MRGLIHSFFFWEVVNGKSSSSGTDHADHADQAEQKQIKRDKYRSNKSYRREANQTDQIIYYNL